MASLRLPYPIFSFFTDCFSVCRTVILNLDMLNDQKYFECYNVFAGSGHHYASYNIDTNTSEHTKRINCNNYVL